MKFAAIFVTFSSIFLLKEVTAQTKYCQASLCPGSKHIACNNNGAFAAACASNAKIIAIPTKLRNIILNSHNQYRNKIAKGGFSGFKPAVRMAPMRWNAELAKLAVLNVKQCAMVHDACRNTAQFKYAGQNLAYSAWSGTTKAVPAVAREHVTMWYNEYKDTTMAYIRKYSNPTNGKVIGHFTQLVQEKATHVGCGILRHTKGGLIYQYMACNYAYTNIMGYPVYRSGNKAAAQCKTGTHKKYKFLCSVKEKYSVNKIP